MTGQASSNPWQFDAVLRPSQSLSSRGLVIFMAALVVPSLALGVFFLARGAWPILGFYGLEVLIIYTALRVSRRRALRYETVRLSDESLVVERGDLRGRRETHAFQPHWVRVQVIDRPDTHTGQVVIASHGRRVGVGTFLSRQERADFARALMAALEFQRGPRGLFPPNAATP